MSTFSDYYKDLLNWENESFKQLIHAWNPTHASSIVADFQSAVAKSDLKSLRIAVVPGSTNQSIGNQVETFFIGEISPHLATYRISKCSGAGYPDQVLQDKQSDQKFVLEIKATSDWNPSDSNRRVLTSSSEKLRKNFTPPICHLLATICYQYQTSGVHVVSVRLDFIEPSTTVSVRLEASVNHKILSQSVHQSKTI